MESALLLVVGTVLLTFTGISFGFYPRPLTLVNPYLLIEALAIAGLVFAIMGIRGLQRVQRIVSENRSSRSGQATAA
ncbi:MAG: hypothetical protein AB7V26_00605 [Lysobacterales bacterium]